MPAERSRIQLAREVRKRLAALRQLAQEFSNFYQKYPIIHEKDREKRVFLLWMTDFFRRQLEQTAGVLGIQIPDYM